MNRLVSRQNTNRSLLLESLENRVLLVAGLGSELAGFASQEELKTALIDKAVQQHEWMFGQEVNEPVCIDWCGPIFRDVDVFFDAVAPNVGNSGPDFSDTNVQVAGVDEGDEALTSPTKKSKEESSSSPSKP